MAERPPPTWEQHSAEAQRLRGRGRFRDALAAYGRALRSNPLDFVSRHFYAGDLAGRIDCLVRLGRYRQAISSIEELWRFERPRSRRLGPQEAASSRGRVPRAGARHTLTRPSRVL